MANAVVLGVLRLFYVLRESVDVSFAFSLQAPLLINLAMLGSDLWLWIT